MQQIVADIRRELAEAGVEFTADGLDEILNLGASLAACLGGHIYFDCGEFWGLELEVDPDDVLQQKCFVTVFYFDEDDSDEEPN